MDRNIVKGVSLTDGRCGQTAGQTGGRTDISVLSAAWSQVKMPFRYNSAGNVSLKKISSLRHSYDLGMKTSLCLRYVKSWVWCKAIVCAWKISYGWLSLKFYGYKKGYENEVMKQRNKQRTAKLGESYSLQLTHSRPVTHTHTHIYIYHSTTMNPCVVWILLFPPIGEPDCRDVIIRKPKEHNPRVICKYMASWSPSGFPRCDCIFLFIDCKCTFQTSYWTNAVTV